MAIYDETIKSKKIKSPARRVKRIKRPRKLGGPLTTRGPKAFVKRPVQVDSPGDRKPAWFFGTLPEWYVYWYLTKKEKLTVDLEFSFQSSLFGGRQALGGLVIDFLIIDRFFPPGLVINVQGEFWHRLTSSQRAKDLLDGIRLRQRGYTVVYVLEDAVLRHLEPTMEKALLGIQEYSDTP